MLVGLNPGPWAPQAMSHRPLKSQKYQILQPDSEHLPADADGEEEDGALRRDAGVGQALAAELQWKVGTAHQENVQDDRHWHL